jgi:hypothetical protein
MVISVCFAAPGGGPFQNSRLNIPYDNQCAEQGNKHPKEKKMNENIFLNQIKRTGVGFAFIIFPLLFIFAFGVHPGLLKPRLLNPEELILRAHGNGLGQFGHVLVTLCTALLIVIALHFMKLLDRSSGA